MRKTVFVVGVLWGLILLWMAVLALQLADQRWLLEYQYDLRQCVHRGEGMHNCDRFLRDESKAQRIGARLSFINSLQQRPRIGDSDE